MTSDQGNYAVDFSDLDNIRWQFQRHFKIVPGNEEDVAILENVIIETTNESEEKLIKADVWIKSPSDSVNHYGLDSFKMQPFDAIWSEYVLTVDLDVGDTLEVQYSIHSDITSNLQHWSLQHSYPVMKSEVSFLIPEVFDYVDHVTDRNYLVKEETLDSTFVLGQGISKGRIKLKGLKLTFADIPPYIEERTRGGQHRGLPRARHLAHGDEVRSRAGLGQRRGTCHPRVSRRNPVSSFRHQR